MPRPVSKSTVKRAQKQADNASKRLAKLEKKSAKSAEKFAKRIAAAAKQVDSKQLALNKVISRRDAGLATRAAKN